MLNRGLVFRLLFSSTGEKKAKPIVLIAKARRCSMALRNIPDCFVGPAILVIRNERPGEKNHHTDVTSSFVRNHTISIKHRSAVWSLLPASASRHLGAGKQSVTFTLSHVGGWTVSYRWGSFIRCIGSRAKGINDSVTDIQIGNSLSLSLSLSLSCVDSSLYCRLRDTPASTSRHRRKFRRNDLDRR